MTCYVCSKERNPVKRHKNTFVFTATRRIAQLNSRGKLPNLLLYFNCQQYGHHEDKYKNDPVCTKCGQPDIHHASLCKKPTKCAICGESHDANSHTCGHTTQTQLRFSIQSIIVKNKRQDQKTKSQRRQHKRKTYSI